MMSYGYLNRATRFTIECKKCGQDFERSVRWIERHDELPCPLCGTLANRAPWLANIKKADEEFRKVRGEMLRDADRRRVEMDDEFEDFE